MSALISADVSLFFFFFNDTATTEIYTLSLHDALPISSDSATPLASCAATGANTSRPWNVLDGFGSRSEEHTSELQSRQYLVCRLLLEKKKKNVLRQQYAANSTSHTHTKHSGKPTSVDT